TALAHASLPAEAAPLLDGLSRLGPDLQVWARGLIYRLPVADVLAQYLAQTPRPPEEIAAILGAVAAENGREQIAAIPGTEALDAFLALVCAPEAPEEYALLAALALDVQLAA